MLYIFNYLLFKKYMYIYIYIYILFYLIIIKLNIFKLENKLSACFFAWSAESFEGKVCFVFRKI